MSGHATQDAPPRNDALVLARAFVDARYCAALDGAPVAFVVGALAAAVEARLPASAYAFVTAWNPRGRSQPVISNTRADDALAARLGALGLDRRRGWAQAPDGRHREAGWLIAGIAPADADALGREFGQAGVLAWRAGTPVRLHMLVPRPPGADLAQVDWIE